MNWPRISIITPSFNQGRYIEQTILSVINQKYPNLEYIVIDGGSTDNTIEIIKKYEQYITYWITEKDKGQSDAINKGLRYCTGEIFNWINSDDYLEPGALFKIAENFRDEKVGTVAGVVCDFWMDGTIQLIQNRRLTIEGMLSEPTDFRYHQPGVWLRTDIMKKVGKYREDYHYCFDHEFMFRYILLNSEVKYISDTLAWFRFHESSKSVSQSKGFFWDLNRIYKEVWKTHKNSHYGQIAKYKYKSYEWPLLQERIGQIYKRRIIAFFAALYLIAKDPVYRLTKSNLGWLKHILLGKRSL